MQIIAMWKSFAKVGCLKAICKCMWAGLCSNSIQQLVMSEIICSGSNVKLHISTHNGEKPYKCQLCQKSFVRSSHVKEHMRIHTGEAPYKCQLCQKLFNFSGNLKMHMRTHTGQKPYKCQFCHNSFSQSSNLKTHMITHTEEKPYKCQLCQKSFVKSSTVKQHMIIHTGDAPYKCQLCQKLFNFSCNLKVHMRTHTGQKPYKCQFCHNSFSQSSHLKTHMRIHTEERPYKCQLCEESFRIVNDLKNHVKTHTGEAPYPCEVCKKGFSYYKNLKRHQRMHTIATVKQNTSYKLNGSSSAKLRKLNAGTQTQDLKISNQSIADLFVRFNAWTGTFVIGKSNEHLLSNIHRESSGKASALASNCLEECPCFSISKSPEDIKPFLEKYFGCGICGEQFEIEKEFQDHCSIHRFSPPDDLFIDMHWFVIRSSCNLKVMIYWGTKFRFWGQYDVTLLSRQRLNRSMKVCIAWDRAHSLTLVFRPSLAAPKVSSRYSMWATRAVGCRWLPEFERNRKLS